MIPTSKASFTRPLWRLLDQYGFDPEPVFREARLDPRRMMEPRGRYMPERVVAVWAKAADLIDAPCFGLRVAEVWNAEDLGILGAAFFTSSSLRTALGRFSRYVRVFDGVIGFHLKVDDKSVSVTYKADKPALNPLPAAQEAAMWSFITSLCRTSCGVQLDPVEVRFRHPEPRCKGEINRFFRCPVRFSAQESAILFAGSDLDCWQPAANRRLVGEIDQTLAAFLNGLQREDLTSRVKLVIVEDLPSGSPSDEAIAKTLSTSSRTLQRRLASAGTTYYQLLDAVRYQLAEQYIADPSRSLKEISFLLGFSGLPAFSRAFRRWTGQAPIAAREAAAT